MTIIVFGATGQMGRQLVKQALWKGHAVKAFGRNMHELEVEGEKLHKIKGSVFDEAEVKAAMKGCNAVLSALGGTIGETDVTRSLGIKKIITAMKALSIKRIVAIGGMGILNGQEEGKYIFDNEDFPEEYKAVTREHFKVYEQLKASVLSWTLLCPPDLIDASYTGTIQVAESYPPSTIYKINTGDLAVFMVNELTENNYVNCRVGISN
jgi:putative NADH-flavin reductase